MNEDSILRDLSPPKTEEKSRWDVYSPGEYCPSVKMSNWWYHREGYPKDYDAFVSQGNMNRSSYNRLGTYKEDGSHWTSVTSESMEKGLGDRGLAELIKQSQPRPMLTFLSYPRTLKVRRDLLKDEIRTILPTLPRELLKVRYSTTYNACYKPVHVIPKN